MKLNAKKLIFLQLYIVLFEGILIDQLGVPVSIKYLSDIVNIGIIILSYNEIRRKINHAHLGMTVGVITIYSVYLIFSAILGGFSSSIILGVWGLRNVLRFLTFFISCMCVLNLNDIEKVFNFLKKLYIINFIIILIQHFVWGYSMDFMGGIFGVTQGCNGPLNMFLVVVITLVFVDYFNGRTKIIVLLMYVISAFYIAGLAELKVAYFEIVFIVALFALIRRPSYKTVLVIVGLVIGMIVGLNLLEKLFPEAYLVVVNFNNLDRYLSASWFGHLEVTRLTAFEVINDHFFKGSFLKHLFGYGLGACDWTSFAISDFASHYSSMNYKSFSFAMKYLETGYTGLILYVSIFVSLLISTVFKRKTKRMTAIEQILIVLLPNIIFMIWYNESTTVEIAYVMYFVLAALGVERIESDRLKIGS